MQVMPFLGVKVDQGSVPEWMCNGEDLSYNAISEICGVKTVKSEICQMAAVKS